MKHHSIQHSTSQRRRGSTLVEAMVSALLVGILSVGTLTAIGAVSRSRQLMNTRVRAHDLAQMLLAEVLQKHYLDDLVPESGIGLNPGEVAPRINFDDVDDFHNWDATPPVDHSGNPLAEYPGWRRQVFVQWVNPGNLVPSVSETQLKKITVRVTSPLGVVTEVHSLRNRHGALEQQPTAAGTIVSWVGVTLKVGPDSTPTTSGISIVNHATD